MKTNWVLIDYENVQPEAVAELDKEHFRVLVFVGAGQTKVSIPFAEALQRMGPRAEYLRVTGHGRNALDFHIAYYLGQLAIEEPDAQFHIVSKDAGFDPLIEHMKAKGVLACRSSDVTDIAAVKVAATKSPSDRIEFVISNLRQRGSSKPRTMKTLRSTISALFQKSLSEDDLDSLLQVLQAKGLLTVTAARVTYNLPQA
jgi:hypothetical protein